MAEFGPELTFCTYLQVLRHRKWRVGSITALGRAAGLGFSHTAHKEYSATAQLLGQPSVNAGGLDAVRRAVRGQVGSAPAVSASEVSQTKRDRRHRYRPRRRSSPTCTRRPTCGAAGTSQTTAERGNPCGSPEWEQQNVGSQSAVQSPAG
jgi:hypothetical protein